MNELLLMLAGAWILIAAFAVWIRRKAKREPRV